MGQGPSYSLNKMSDLEKVSMVREPMEGEEFWNLLECPVCYQIPFGEILMCEAGHHVCKNCKTRIEDSCPLCRSFMGDALRNLPMEKIIGASTFTCPNECNMSLRFKGKEMVEHVENECDCRDVLCPHCLVDKTAIKMDNFIAHLENTHNAFGVDKSAYTFTRPNVLVPFHRSLPAIFFVEESQRMSIPYFMKFDDFHFLVNFEINESYTSQAIWISIIGTPKEANDYLAQIACVNNGFIVKFDLQVVSFRKSSPGSNFGENAAVISLDELKDFSSEATIMVDLNDGQELEFLYSIKLNVQIYRKGEKLYENKKKSENPAGDQEILDSIRNLFVLE